MKTLSNKLTKNPFISVICCLHGNEKFGLRVFQALKKQINLYPNLQLIIANEEAIKINKRFVEQDLNRSFPGQPQGNHETKLADKILKKIQKSHYVLDVHTTISKTGFLTPIFAKRNKNINRIINLLPSENIIFIQPPLADLSLIGNVENGLSLEFSKEETKGKKAIETIKKLIGNLYAKQINKPIKRQLFFVNGTISKEIKIPKNAKNFQLIKKHKIYPFLLKESSYKNNQGLKADKKTQELI